MVAATLEWGSGKAFIESAGEPANQEIHTMNVEVDQDSCIGCGLCCELCPTVFKMADDTRTATVLSETVPEDYEDCTQQASEDCPVAAILLV